jgi:amidohydrolase
MTFLIIVIAFCALSSTAYASSNDAKASIETLAERVEKKVIAWRRHFHEHPELSNREFKTAEKVANHLKNLGMQVQTGVAHTGVVGLLNGGKAGPVVALRADMDGLPVTERVGIPFASKAQSTYRGLDVGVMHACGHDTHIAILMGVAEVLAEIKNELPGPVKFVFQPAEEGAPPGEEGGAKMMIKEGVLENPKPDVIFGLHINSKTEVGQIKYRPGGLMAAADRFRIKVSMAFRRLSAARPSSRKMLRLSLWAAFTAASATTLFRKRWR